jgi:hypothetical protein
MAVRSVPEKYVACDGSEFESKVEAERHDTLISAQRQFDNAKDRLRQAIIRTYKTADGLPFDFGLFHDYWYVADGFHWPALSQVSFMGYQQEYRISEHDESRLLLVEKQNGRDVHYDVSQLYANRKDALVALLAARKRRLRMYQEDIEAIEKEIAAKT